MMASLSDFPSQILILLWVFLSTWCPLFDSFSFLSFLITFHWCFGRCHTFVLFVVVVYLLVFVCLLLLNICLPKLINSTGYWLPELKQLVCAQSTHVPKLNYQQRAYYPNQPIIRIFKVGFHKISLENSARISRVRCIVHFWKLHLKFHRSAHKITWKKVIQVKVELVCMAYGDIIAFVLSSNSMLTFIVCLQTWKTFMLTSIRWKSGITSSKLKW